MQIAESLRAKKSGPGVDSASCNLHAPFESLPAHAISTKNKHLLLSCDTNPRFHGGSFGVLGHTSSEALQIAKAFQSSWRAFSLRVDTAHRWNASAFLRFNSFVTLRHHQDVVLFSVTVSLTFRPTVNRHTFPTTKNPAYFAVSRVLEILCSIRYLLTFPLSKFDSGARPIYGLDSPRLNAQLWLNRL
jgi:hypothetical protein